MFFSSQLAGDHISNHMKLNTDIAILIKPVGNMNLKFRDRAYLKKIVTILTDGLVAGIIIFGLNACDKQFNLGNFLETNLVQNESTHLDLINNSRNFHQFLNLTNIFLLMK